MFYLSSLFARHIPSGSQSRLLRLIPMFGRLNLGCFATHGEGAKLFGLVSLLLSNLSRYVLISFLLQKRRTPNDARFPHWRRHQQSHVDVINVDKSTVDKNLTNWMDCGNSIRQTKRFLRSIDFRWIEVSNDDLPTVARVGIFSALATIFVQACCRQVSRRDIDQSEAAAATDSLLLFCCLIDKESAFFA